MKQFRKQLPKSVILIAGISVSGVSFAQDTPNNIAAALTEAEVSQIVTSCNSKIFKMLNFIETNAGISEKENDIKDAVKDLRYCLTVSVQAQRLQRSRLENIIQFNAIAKQIPNEELKRALEKFKKPAERIG